MRLINFLLKIFTSATIDRVLDSIDKRTDAGVERERLRTEAINTWLRNRNILPWWLDAFFIVPLGIWWASILLYNIFWHNMGLFPQTWNIAALPPPLDIWAGWIVASRFGVGGLSILLRK